MSLPAERGPQQPRAVREVLQATLFPDYGQTEPSVGFLARAFIVATLPHSRPSGNEFTRRNGYYRLTLLAPTEIGLPYGRYPRLALAWMTTRAVKTKSPYLELGPSFSKFAQSLGITPTTGPRGSLSGLREQVHRLLGVSLSCHWDTTEAPNMADRGSKGHTGYNLCYQHQLWWDHAKNEPSWLLLNTDFFNELATRPVPIDMNVIQQLRAPLEIDLYTWLTWRSIRSSRIARPELVPWNDLHLQFGSDYADLRVFKFKVLKHLRTVLRHYSSARLEPTSDGLKLLPYAPHVPRLFPGHNLPINR